MNTKAPLSPLPENLRVLVATPHRDFASALTAMLRALRVKSVSKVHESATVCRLLKSTRYDALILDSAIGPEDGVAITRKMRTSEECPNTTLPVIMISSAAGRKFIETARDAGIHEFIRMPVSGEILHARLHTALSRPREFVASQSYAGPDRRRRKDSYKGPERRAGARKAAS